MRTSLAAVFLALISGPGLGQQATDKPMSAINWLSDSVHRPVQAVPSGTVDPTEPGTATDASVSLVTAAPLGQAVPNAVGILPVTVTGLPRDLWRAARPDDLARNIRDERADMLPAVQSLLYTLLLAELDPPESPDPSGAQIFLARVDKLLEMGALEQAAALLERAGPEHPEVFRRWFDVALLMGHEDRLCEIMRATPELSPTFTARAFCLARGGDWNAAALTLETGRALGFINAEEDELLARFLDPELAEGAPPLPRPAHPTPLIFRMFEAIGEAIPTAGLPLAFAHSDLRSNIGWKARIEAGERLARTGAVSANQLLGLYSERKPAASGGVWDRVAAVQALDAALSSDNARDLAEALPRAWGLMQESELEVPFAAVYATALSGRSLDDTSARIAFHLGLLSADYELTAVTSTRAGAEDLVLRAVALGRIDGVAAPGPRYQAVIDGFAAGEAPVRLRSLLADNRLGEAVLRAMSLLTSGANGDLDEVSDALALFRAVGLEETARRAALEYLLLERRG